MKSKSKKAGMLVATLLIVLVSFVGFNSQKAAAEGLRTVAIGDSNTEGSNFNQLYPNDLDKRWTNLTGVTNLGMSGTNTRSGVKKVDEALSLNPQAVVVMYGLIDSVINANTQERTVSITEFETNMRTIVNKIKAKGAKPILMTNIPVINSIYHARYPELMEGLSKYGGMRKNVNAYNEVIRKIGKESGNILIDNYLNVFSKLPSGNSAGDAELSQSKLIDSTGTHWTPAGHSMIAYSVNYYIK